MIIGIINSVFNLQFMKVSTENDNNFGYEKITIVVDNIPLNAGNNNITEHRGVSLKGKTIVTRS
jgi:hypothetical protein